MQGQRSNNIVGAGDDSRAERRRTVTRQKKELIKKIDTMGMGLDMEIAVEKEHSFCIGPPAGAFADREDEFWRMQDELSRLQHYSKVCPRPFLMRKCKEFSQNAPNPLHLVRTTFLNRGWREPMPPYWHKLFWGPILPSRGRRPSQKTGIGGIPHKENSAWTAGGADDTDLGGEPSARR